MITLREQKTRKVREIVLNAKVCGVLERWLAVWPRRGAGAHGRRLRMKKSKALEGGFPALLPECVSVSIPNMDPRPPVNAFDLLVRRMDGRVEACEVKVSPRRQRER